MTQASLPEIPYLDRFSMYAQLGLVRVMEPETEILMRERADRAIRQQDYGPHERPWFSSFHASEFPGEPESACKRYLLYRMMDLPPSEPMPPWVTTTGEVGKAIELDIANAYFEGGRLLAIPETHMLSDGSKPHQLGFMDPNVWMTASTDLPWLPKGWRAPFITEVKSKADDVVEEMINGAQIVDGKGAMRLRMRQPDKAHINQLKATLGLAHEFDWGWVNVCGNCWFVTSAQIYERLGLPGGAHPMSDAYNRCPRCKDYTDGEFFELEPPISGEIYYASRSWPRKTKSFYYEYDPDFLSRGRQVLAETREHFLRDEIPDRPDHFQWSIGPCAQCRFKPTVCRPDAGLPGRKKTVDSKILRSKLSESHGIEYAKSMIPSYDYSSKRSTVAEIWSHDG